MYSLSGSRWWKVGETDFGPYITQIMSAKPDFIILGCAGSSIIGFHEGSQGDAA